MVLSFKLVLFCDLKDVFALGGVLPVVKYIDCCTQSGRLASNQGSPGVCQKCMHHKADCNFFPIERDRQASEHPQSDLKLDTVSTSNLPCSILQRVTLQDNICHYLGVI